MAKCGCTSSVCNCVVQAGDGVTVTGAGTAANPYVVAADPADVVTVADTNTVNMTKAGNVITSDVIVDPVAGELITSGPAGLAVTCEAVQDCVGNAFGPGLLYDDAGNQFRARISSDPGNTVMFGGDNGLFSAPGAFSCASLATCSIDSLSDVNTTTDPPNNGELLVWNGANWVPRPVECGLTSDASGLSLNTTPYNTLTRHTCADGGDLDPTTPLGCVDTNGQAIYCDSVGTLRTKPEKYTVSRLVAGINEALGPATIPFTSSVISGTITNPSPCYCMCGYVSMASISYLSSTANANPEESFQFDLDNGGGFTGFGVWARDTRGVTSLSQDRHRFFASLNICLDPGETKTIQFRVAWTLGPVHAGGTSQVIAAAREIRFFGVNV